MKLSEAQKILDLKLQADAGVGSAACFPPSKAQVKAAQAVVDYHADRDYNSAAGRIYRAKRK